MAEQTEQPERCVARRPERGDGDCNETPGRWKVVTRSASGAVLSEVGGCFVHCMAEADRSAAAGSIARADVEPADG